VEAGFWEGRGGGLVEFVDGNDGVEEGYYCGRGRERSGD
jgi:hypothetical protein